MNSQTFQLLLFGGAAVLIVLLMVRNSRKRSRDQAELGAKLKPGAQIMTTFGVFGTIVSVDDEENKIVLETSPGSTLTIHRQALGRVVPEPEPEPAADATATTPAVEARGTVLNGEPVESPKPRFGERTPAPTADDPGAARRASGDSSDQ